MYISHNKWLLSLASLLVFFALSCGSSSSEEAENTDNNNAQNTENTNQSETQQSSDNQATTNYNVPKKFTYFTQKGDDFLIDNFYPIGWSADGKFAYISEPADEATGFYFFRLIIQDVQTDKVLEEKKYDDEEGTETFQTTWEKKKDEITALLKKYGIKQTAFEMKPTDFTALGNGYSAKMSNTTQLDKDYQIDMIYSTKVVVSSPELGSKTIYNYTEKEYSLILTAALAGSIQNPDNQAETLIIHFAEQRGYEGPPNVIHFYLSGCNLNSGFKKAS